MKKKNAMDEFLGQKYRSDTELRDINEITRLESLLESKRSEYQVFGMTGEDAVKDIEIRKHINILRQSLRL